MKRFKGCGTALITPFDKEGNVDLVKYGELIDRQVENGVHFIVPLGTTGETPCLSDKEKLEIIQVAGKHCAGRPVLIGAGTNSTQGTIDNMKKMDCNYVDGFLIVTPYYNKPSQKGLYEHFKAVAASTKKSIVIYNVPGRTGVNITAETTLKLAEIPNIVAIKEASGNYGQIAQIIKNAPEGFDVLSGNDDEVLSLMATGAAGVISVASNIAPAMMVEMVEHLAAGRLDDARKLHYRLMPLFKNCFIESNPIPAKAGMAYMGLIENIMRLPLTPATEQTYEIMKQTIDNLK